MVLLHLNRQRLQNRSLQRNNLVILLKINYNGKAFYVWEAFFNLHCSHFTQGCLFLISFGQNVMLLTLKGKNMSQITMRQMIEAGVHFGHQTRYWNPKMAQYIFGVRNKIHIINLEKTVPLFQEAQEVVRRLVANKGTVLFVGTKRQARDIIKEEAQRAGMPYVDHRWLGGMLTNYKTVKQSIKRLEEKAAVLANAETSGYNKKELLDMTREVEKLERSLGGIKDMKGLPDAIFVIDTGYQHGTLVEAAKLGIPVIAVVDSNNSPDLVKHIIPGNDDSAKAIRLYCRGIADAVLEGKNQAVAETVAAAKAAE